MCEISKAKIWNIGMFQSNDYENQQFYKDLQKLIDCIDQSK